MPLRWLSSCGPVTAPGHCRSHTHIALMFTYVWRASHMQVYFDKALYQCLLYKAERKQADQVGVVHVGVLTLLRRMGRVGCWLTLGTLPSWRWLHCTERADPDGSSCTQA